MTFTKCWQERARADKAERDLARMTEERDLAIREREVWRETSAVYAKLAEWAVQERDAAVLAEREACAKVLEQLACSTATMRMERGWRDACKTGADAIRARSTPAPVQPLSDGRKWWMALGWFLAGTSALMALVFAMVGDVWLAIMQGVVFGLLLGVLLT